MHACRPLPDFFTPYKLETKKDNLNLKTIYYLVWLKIIIIIFDTVLKNSKFLYKKVLIAKNC